MRVAPRGKSFFLDGLPFQFRGLRYERSREPADPADGDSDRLGLDLPAIADAGYTVVSVPPPPLSAIEQAAASGLRFMLEMGHVSLDALVAAPRRERKGLVRDWAMDVRRAVQPWAGSEALLGIAFGAPRSSPASGECARRAADDLAITLHDEDAGLMAGWLGAWPVDCECPAEFDFLIVSVGLSSPDELAPTLMACHGNVGDRPVVLDGVSLTGAKAGSEAELPWVIDTALSCGVAGTIAPAWSPGVAVTGGSEIARLNQRTVRDLDVDWPSISVVVNAYNAQDTLDECLSHCDRLGYPRLEVIVVDDGSTDATPAIAGAHPRAQLVTTAHDGLSAGRNAGYRSSHGELIAYLDADAYPSPEWPWYLALAALGDRVGGAGGPNVPPPHEPPLARVVARSPGGPVPQLLGADRAAHLPGCNMAFWRQVLEQLHGFDPVLEGAEDIEFEWRVFGAGHQIAYHPAALVWHHRRPGLGPYLRQQRHYGRSQAILERRYPELFPAGFRFRNAASRLFRRRGEAGSEGPYVVKYLALPRDEGVPVELAHQWGIPAAIVLGLTAPLGLVRRTLAAPAIGGAAFVAAVFAIDVAAAGKGRRRSERTLGFRATVAAFRLLRPLAFRWGHLDGRREPLRATPDRPPPGAEASAQHAFRPIRAQDA